MCRYGIEYEVDGRISRCDAMFAQLLKIMEFSQHSPRFFGALAEIQESRRRRGEESAGHPNEDVKYPGHLCGTHFAQNVRRTNGVYGASFRCPVSGRNVAMRFCVAPSLAR